MARKPRKQQRRRLIVYAVCIWYQSLLQYIRALNKSRQQFSDENMARIASAIAMANDNLAKINTTYCIEGDLAMKCQFLYRELAKFSALSVAQRMRATRHLDRDDGDARTFFQFPTDEEKLAFVWTILE